MMPSLRTHKKLSKPWHARSKRDGLEYSLGYFETWDEAHEEELNFAEWYVNQYSYSASTRRRKRPQCENNNN